MSTYRARVAALEELESVHEAWNRLALSMAEPTVFCTWEWCFEWWRCYAPNYKELVVLFITAGSDLKGIVPLVKYSARPGLRGWLGGRILSYCSVKDLYVDQVDIICAPQDMAPCVEALYQFLRSEYVDWDVCEFPLVKSNSGLAQLVEKISLESDGPLLADWRPRSRAPYICTNGRTFDQYVATLDGNRRYEIRKRAKALASNEMRYTTPNSGTEEEALATVFELHAARAGQKRMKSTFDGARVRQFHLSFAAKAARLDWLWLRFLKLGTHSIAAYYGFQFGGRAFYFQSGFDPTRNALSPGKTMIDEVLREVFAKGLGEFNFLQGGEQYKSTWAREVSSLFAGSIHSRSAWGRLNWFAIRLRLGARSLLRRAARAQRTVRKRESPFPNLHMPRTDQQSNAGTALRHHSSS